MNRIAFVTRRAITQVALAFACGSLLSAATITYNLTTDWSNTSNPNGVWSYDQGSTPLPYQPNLGSGSCFGMATGITGGYAPGINFGNSPPCLPTMFQATGDAANTNDWLAGDVVVHAQDPTNGEGQGQATIVWTAPFTGTFTFTGAVWYAHSAVQRSDDFTLSLGSAILASGTVAYNSAVGNGRSNPLDFSSSSSTAVNAGDQVELVIQRSSGSTGTMAGVQFAITETPAAVPEPSTALLGFIGIIATGLLRKRLIR